MHAKIIKTAPGARHIARAWTFTYSNEVIYIVYLQTLWNERHAVWNRESSLRSQQQRKVERSRPYLSSLPEEKSNQAESPLVGFVWRNSAVRHVKLNIMMSIWDKTSVTEYFQRHCKFKLLSFVFLCYFFSFTKGLQQQNNNNILFHTLYITCYDIQRALATLDF